MTGAPRFAENDARMMPHPSQPRWRQRVLGRATPTMTTRAVVAYLLSVAILQLADLWLASEAPGVPKPDLSPGYDHARVVEIFEAYGAGGRTAYAWGLVIDTIMPIALGVAGVFVVALAVPRWLGRLAIAPVTFAVLDVIENALFAVMLSQYPAISEGLVAVARPITIVKLSAFVVALPTLIVGVGVLLARWRRGRQRR
jgi:hypothetical protein